MEFWNSLDEIVGVLTDDEVIQIILDLRIRRNRRSLQELERADLNAILMDAYIKWRLNICNEEQLIMLLTLETNDGIFLNDRGNNVNRNDLLDMSKEELIEMLNGALYGDIDIDMGYHWGEQFVAYINSRKLRVQNVRLPFTLKTNQVDHAATLLSGLVTPSSNARCTLDGSDTGRGKTYTATYVAFMQGYEHILVICPKSIFPKWNAILSDVGIFDFRVATYSSMTTTRVGGRRTPKYQTNEPKSKLEPLEWVTARNGKKTKTGADADTDPIFNWEGLPSNTLVIWDEVHKSKNISKKRGDAPLAAHLFDEFVEYLRLNPPEDVVPETWEEMEDKYKYIRALYLSATIFEKANDIVYMLNALGEIEKATLPDLTKYKADKVRKELNKYITPQELLNFGKFSTEVVMVVYASLVLKRKGLYSQMPEEFSDFPNGLVWDQIQVNPEDIKSFSKANAQLKRILMALSSGSLKLDANGLGELQNAITNLEMLKISPVFTTARNDIENGKSVVIASTRTRSIREFAWKFEALFRVLKYYEDGFDERDLESSYRVKLTQDILRDQATNFGDAGASFYTLLDEALSEGGDNETVVQYVEAFLTENGYNVDRFARELDKLTEESASTDDILEYFSGLYAIIGPSLDDIIEFQVRTGHEEDEDLSVFYDELVSEFGEGPLVKLIIDEMTLPILAAFTPLRETRLDKMDIVELFAEYFRWDIYIDAKRFEFVTIIAGDLGTAKNKYYSSANPNLKKRITESSSESKFDEDLRAENIYRFQQNESRVFLFNIAVGKEGIDLHDTSVGGMHPRIMYVMPGLVAIDIIQTLGRVVRQGQTSDSERHIVYIGDVDRPEADGGSIKSFEVSWLPKMQAKIEGIHNFHKGNLSPEVIQGAISDGSYKGLLAGAITSRPSKTVASEGRRAPPKAPSSRRTTASERRSPPEEEIVESTSRGKQERDPDEPRPARVKAAQPVPPPTAVPVKRVGGRPTSAALVNPSEGPGPARAPVKTPAKAPLVRAGSVASRKVVKLILSDTKLIVTIPPGFKLNLTGYARKYEAEGNVMPYDVSQVGQNVTFTRNSGTTLMPSIIIQFLLEIYRDIQRSAERSGYEVEAEIVEPKGRLQRILDKEVAEED